MEYIAYGNLTMIHIQGKDCCHIAQQKCCYYHMHHGLSWLTHCGQVRPYDDMDLGQQWLR